MRKYYLLSSQEERPSLRRFKWRLIPSFMKKKTFIIKWKIPFKLSIERNVSRDWENENLLGRIQGFLKNWDSYSKTDKVRALKNDQVGLFERENEENSELIKKSTEAFKGKSRTIEKKIDEILKELSFSEKVLDFQNIIASLNNALIESKTKI